LVVLGSAHFPCGDYDDDDDDVLENESRTLSAGSNHDIILLFLM
jgi:hypothetical protein